MKSLKYLNKYLWKYKYRLILGFFFVAISNVFGIYPAQIIREAFDTVAQSDELKTVSDDSVIAENSKTGVMNFLTDLSTDMDLGETLLFFAVLVLSLIHI